MSTKTRSTENRIEKRTRRACVESMTVVAHGEGTGMFDVYSGENAEPYVVDHWDGSCFYHSTRDTPQQ